MGTREVQGRIARLVLSKPRSYCELDDIESRLDSVENIIRSGIARSKLN
jgi:hypothetical protein